MQHTTLTGWIKQADAMQMCETARPALQPGDLVRWSRCTGTVERAGGDVADIRQDRTDALWRLPVAELTRVVG